MNLLSKAYSLLALSLLCTSSVMGQSTDHPSSQKRYGMESESPAMSECGPPYCMTPQNGWDIFAGASFIYWYPYQENMELGIIDDTTNPDFIINGDMVDLNPDYKPSFKVLLGVTLPRKGWDLLSRYTWFRSTQNIRVDLDRNGNEVLHPLWEIPNVTSPTYFNGTSRWRLRMDLLDLELGKLYCGTSDLSYRPFFGIRAAWIRQSIVVEYFNESTQFLNRANVFMTQRSQSWALGLRSGMTCNLMLGKCFRIYGEGAGDLLFTQYTSARLNQIATTAAGILAPNSIFTLREKNLNRIRAHLELELGFGWGTYFANNSWHFDWTAGYGFQVFFDQNMFRNILDDQAFASILPNGNLYIHGLTTTMRFDF